jgi:hypothetical protein
MNVVVDIIHKQDTGIAGDLEAKIAQKNSEIPSKVNSKENKYINMSEKFLVVSFLRCLGEEKYAEAHKYLHKIMESKLAIRIAKNKGLKLF